MPFRLTPTIKVLMITCVVLFLVQQTADQFLGGNLIGWLGLVPSAFVMEHRFWQLITYAFLHADVMHLVLNLLMLAFIGGEIEAVWGTFRFLRFYFLCSVSAGVFYLFLQLFVWQGSGLHVPMVGASGAIYGLLMAYGLMFGERVLLFMMLFPMKAKHFVWILAGIEFFSTVFSGRGGLSNAAHLGGMFTGFVFLWGSAAIRVYRKNRKQQGPSRSKKQRRRKGTQHLKLVINNERDSVGDGESDDESGQPPTWH